MRAIEQMCSSVLSGAALQPEQMEYLKSYMLDQGNLPEICYISQSSPSVFTVFVPLSRESIRTAEYFGSGLKKSQILQSLQSMLETVSSLMQSANVFSQHQFNMLLSFYGSILAQMIHQSAPLATIVHYFWKVQGGQNLLKTKKHMKLKICGACLQQINTIRINYTSFYDLKRQIYEFITKYGPWLCEHVTEIITELINEKADEDAFSETLIFGVVQLQQNFLTCMGQDEEQLKEIVQIDKNSVIALNWQQNLLVEWLRINTILLRPMIEQQSRVHNLSTLSTKLIATVFHIYHLFSSTQSKYGPAEVYDILAENLVLPSLSHAVTNSAISMSSNTVTAFMKILNLQKYFLSKVVRTLDQSNHNYERMKPSLAIFKQYCELVINNSDFNFDNCEECPVFLALNLFYTVKGICLEDCEGATEVKIQAQSWHRELFQDAIIYKLYNLKDSSSTIDEFHFLEVEEDYFREMIGCAPHYLCSNPLEASKHKEQQSTEQFQAELSKSSSLSSYKPSRDLKYFEDLFDNIWQSSSETDSPQVSLHLVACIRALFISIPCSEEKFQLLYDLFQVVLQISPFQQKCQKVRENIQISKLYILKMILNQVIPEEFILEGQIACKFAQSTEQEFAFEFEDIVVHSLQEIIHCIGTKKQQSASKIRRKHSEIVHYAFDILLQLCQKLSDRIEIVTEQPAQNQQDEEIYEDLINVIFDQILKIEIATPACAYKLHSIAGILANIFGLEAVYEGYGQICLDTIKGIVQNPCHYSQSATSYRIGMYLSSVAGFLSSIQKKSLAKVMVEIVLEDVRALISLGCFKIDEEMLETFLQFIKQLSTPKTFTYPHDRNCAIMDDLFTSLLAEWLPACVQIPDLYDLTQRVYLSWARLEVPSILIPLKQNKAIGFPSNHVLSEYFQNLSRLQELSVVEEYAYTNIKWMISLLEQKIERNRPGGMPSIQSMVFNFSQQKLQQIEKLTNLLSQLYPEMNKNNLRSQFIQSNS